MRLSSYFPIVIFAGTAAFIPLLVLVASYLLSPKNSYRQKNTSYECGFDAFGNREQNARNPFDVQFYLVAILFIIFDLEIAFLFPWAIMFKKIGGLGFFSMMLFLLVLTIGYCYEWKKGALEWS
jgi:NADH-quinone oxidoreductase subunit A